MDIPRPSKTCSVSHRELLPGDEFFSVLTDEDGLLRRLDIAAEYWNSPPENCLGWWKTAVPENTAKKDAMILNGAIPNDSLLKIFEELTFAAENGYVRSDVCGDVRYVLTLLLLRRRLFRLEREETGEDEKKTMFIVSLRDSTEYAVAVVMPDQERLEEIQRILEDMAREMTEERTNF
ncbi:MAG: hypothetical protein LBT46_06385 [Planctomycetaceae bacterium]|jgi:hypothetical protein|nr:hypothetical protein [Planctomycetaceae bacterium]